MTVAPRSAPVTTDVPPAPGVIEADGSLSPGDLADLMRAYEGAAVRLQVAHAELKAEVAGLKAELKAKNEELARKTRLAALGQMAAGVAHEIRNPLGAIRLFAGILKRDLTDARHTGYADNILRAVTSTDRIVEEMLCLARTREPALRPSRLADVIAAALDSAARDLDERHVTVTRTGDEAHTVAADPEQLRRAFLNIIINAAQAMDAGGRLRIAVAAADDGVAVRFTDTGPGIDPAALDTIFDPFYTGRDDGIGLGLALVHRIVESHHGRVWAENNPEGGATFTVALPPCEECSDGGR